MDSQAVIDATRRWIVSMVVGLNLCPFARKVYDSKRIRFITTEGTTQSDLLEVLARELKLLAATPITDVETTILIHPNALTDFEAYNDFLTVADDKVEALGMRGTIQIASFHPQYRFAKTAKNAVDNYTNRSPYPMLHLLREESISRLTASTEELLAIPKRNVETLRKLGLENVRRRNTE